MAKVPSPISGNEAESELLLSSPDEESQSDTGFKSEPVSNIDSTEHQKQGDTVEEKLTELDFASGRKLKDVDDNSICKLAEKLEDPDGVSLQEEKIATSESQRSLVTNEEKEAKIGAENSNIKPANKFIGKFEFLSAKFARKHEDSSGKLSGKSANPVDNLVEKPEDPSNAREALNKPSKFEFLSAKFAKKPGDSTGKLSGKPEDPTGKLAEKPEDPTGKLAEKPEDPTGKLAAKPKDPVDASEAKVVSFVADKQMVIDDDKEAKIPTEKSDINSDVFASKHDFKAASGESMLSEGASAIPESKISNLDSETFCNKEIILKKSPKARGSRAKESPKRVSVLSAASSGDGRDGGCFSGLSPKRFYGLFKIRSPKLKASPSLSAAFSPIGDGKHFEVVYLGRYLPAEHERVERIDYTNMAEEKIIPTFLGSRPCYDVMPTSGKVVVFSVELLVKNAFSALVSNEIKAAPLWDAGIMDFVGMLTISDFINVLKYYYITKPEDMKDIENQSIATWRRMTGVPKKFVKINGQDSLSLAAKLLIQERIHRIPVFDEKRQCVLFVLTKKRLLQFLSQGLLEKFDKTNVRTPSFFKKTIRELKIGTFEDIAVVTKETKIIDALSIFITRNVSALPVLDKDNILIDIFEKFDVFGLAKDQTYHNLEMTVDDVISKPYARETAWICTMDETLETVIDKFVLRKVHRLVVIDARRGIAGMISLSDVLKLLVVQPLALMESATVSDTILEGTEGAVGGAEDESDCPVEVDLTTGVAHMKIEVSETTDDPQEEEPSADD